MAPELVLLSSKLGQVRSGVYRHWCPGCNSYHDFFVDEPAEGTGARWHFNNDVAVPSFTPSMHITYGPWTDEEDPSIHIPKTTQCHYFLTNGVIEFLSDCEHNLKGMKVPMSNLPAWKW